MCTGEVQVLLSCALSRFCSLTFMCDASIHHTLKPNMSASSFFTSATVIKRPDVRLSDLLGSICCPSSVFSLRSEPEPESDVKWSTFHHSLWPERLPAAYLPAPMSEHRHCFDVPGRAAGKLQDESIWRAKRDARLLTVGRPNCFCSGGQKESALTLQAVESGFGIAFLDICVSASLCVLPQSENMTSPPHLFFFLT